MTDVNIDPAQVRALRKELSAQCAAIRKNPTLSATGQKAAIALAYKNATAQADTWRAEFLASVETERRAVERQLFTAGDTDVVARRDAGDRAERITNPTDAIRLMEDAILHGDHSLGQAVLRRAVRHGWTHVVDRAAEENPDISDELQRFSRLGDVENIQRASVFGYAVIAPDELRGMSAEQVSRLAAEYQPPGEANPLGENQRYVTALG